MNSLLIQTEFHLSKLAMPSRAINPLLMWIDSSMHKHKIACIKKILIKVIFIIIIIIFLASTWTAAFLAVGLTLLMNTLKMK